MRPWKVRDPEARDHIGVGAFNLIRRSAYNQIGTYERLRLEVVDDLKLGEAIKKAGLRQDVVFGRDLVSLRWGVGAAGIIRNLEKNLFAFLQFRLSLVLAVCAMVFFLCVWPFAGLWPSLRSNTRLPPATGPGRRGSFLPARLRQSCSLLRCSVRLLRRCAMAQSPGAAPDIRWRS
jgi:hypothetical protein